MSIRPIDFNMMQRMQDVSQIKQNEIDKPLVEQSHIQADFQKETFHKSEQVTKKENADQNETRYDAKDESNNKYKKKPQKKIKKSTLDNGKVSIKESVKKYKVFDIKI